MPEPQSCDWGKTRCRHSVENAGLGMSKCVMCRLSPDNRYTQLPSHWVPLPVYSSKPHPLLKAEKVLRQRDQQVQRQQERLSKDRSKQKLLKKASKAEKDTEKVFTATKNSGRLNRDGDAEFHGISLDVKLQTTREDPVVRIHELEKINRDAIRAGNQVGALVIRNKHGYGCVVLTEESFVRLMSSMNVKVEETTESRCNESKVT